MAVKVTASGDARDFAAVWESIKKLVGVEWQSVLRECGNPPPGFYEVSLELTWDIDKEEGIRKQPCGHPVSHITQNPEGSQWCKACEDGHENAVMKCATCGTLLQLVRPGKWQCPKCE